MNQVLQLLAEWWTIVIPMLLFGIEMLGIYSAWHAINKVRTSQGAVAWAVGLVMMPFLMLPLYWVLGRNRFAGYLEAIRQVEQQHKSSVAAVRQELMTEFNASDPAAHTPLGRLADVLDTPLSLGNEFELLIDGDAFFEKLLTEIRSAEHYIYAEFFIIKQDEIGNRFADALCEQARAGKVVRLIYDEFGCLKLPDAYLDRLRGAGVETEAFNTRQGWVNRFQLNFRNHRKILIIDGERAIVGGFNIGDEYLGHLKWATSWRDTGLMVSGPGARKLQAVFASDYYWACRTDLPEAKWSVVQPNSNSADIPSPANEFGSGAVVCATGPADKRSRATMMFAAAAEVSNQRLWISSPYLVPDETCINALSMARARGVDVRILVPSHADHWLVYLAGFYYENLFESIGIPIYRYQDGFLHQKCILVDDVLALIGSTNLDNRSLHLNFELMLATNSKTVIEQVSDMLERDFRNATARDIEDHRLLPWYQRAGTVLARLFSPVL